MYSVTFQHWPSFLYSIYQQLGFNISNKDIFYIIKKFFHVLIHYLFM